MKWKEDAYAERVIKEFGASFQPKTIAIAQIDRQESMANHARPIKAIEDEVVEDYALAMERGDSFPKLVVLPTAKNKYMILGGNHRYEAADLLGEQTVDVMVVESEDPATKDLLPRILNRGHGVRETRAEAIANAIWAMDEHKKTIQQAAEMFGIKVESLREEIRAKDIKSLLDSRGVRTIYIPRTTILKCGTIDNQNVLVAASRVVADAKMNLSQATDFIKEIRKSNQSEASQMAVISQHEKKLLLNGHSTPEPVKSKRNIRTKFLISLSTIEKCTAEKKKLSQLQIVDKSEVESVSSRLNALSKKLLSISRSSDS